MISRHLFFTLIWFHDFHFLFFLFRLSCWLAYIRRTRCLSALIERCDFRKEIKICIFQQGDSHAGTHAHTYTHMRTRWHAHTHSHTHAHPLTCSHTRTHLTLSKILSRFRISAGFLFLRLLRKTGKETLSRGWCDATSYASLQYVPWNIHWSYILISSVSIKSISLSPKDLDFNPT